MCFRRNGKGQLGVTTESIATMTEQSFLQSQRLNANLSEPIECEKLKNEHVAATEPFRRRNPFSERKSSENRVTNNKRNELLDIDVAVRQIPGRHKLPTRSNRHHESPNHDNDNRNSRTDRSSRRKRSHERSPVCSSERSGDYSRDRKRGDRSSSSRHKNRKDDGGDTDLRHKLSSNDNRQNKRSRRNSDRRNDDNAPKKSERCDVKVEPIEKAKLRKRKSKDSLVASRNGNKKFDKPDATQRSERMVNCVAPENGHEKSVEADRSSRRSLAKSQNETEEGEIDDSLEIDDQQINVTENNLQVASTVDISDVSNKQAVSNAMYTPEGSEIVAKTVVESIDVRIENKMPTQSTESAPNDNHFVDKIMSDDAMDIDIIQSISHENETSVDVIDESVPIETEQAVLVPTTESNENDRNSQQQAIIEMPKTHFTDSTITSEEGNETQASPLHEIESKDPIIEKNESDVHAATDESEKISPNTSLSKSVKNVSTNSTDYQIVEEENKEIVIYVTRRKVKKSKKEKH